MAAHTKIDLYQMQSLPLDAKIRMTARRIDAFIDRNDAYLSISGGKDSRVLDDIERRFVRAKLPRVFIDTGLEHRSVRACGKKHADIILRPEKNFKQIITEYGYPVISKEVAQTIAEARKGLKNGNCYTYRMAKLNGTAVDKNGDKSKYNIPQYKFLLDAPFRISHKCCDYMKKKPAKQYEKETGRLPIVATMAEESNLRLQKWLKHGCNAFDLKRPMSAPMSFWSENDVLEYLFKYELDYAECYGKIIPKLDKEQIEGQITIYEATNDYRGCQFCTTGCKRTGCIFCLFGILQDKDRIIKLEKEDKRLADYDIFVKKGLITLSGENYVDYHDVYDWFTMLLEDYGIRPLKIGYDRYSAQYLITDMANYGFHMDDVYQGENLTPVIREFEGIIKDGDFKIADNNLLKTHFLNVALKHNMETRKFRPIKIEQRAHIDGFVSVIDAMTVRQKYWEECGELLKNAA